MNTKIEKFTDLSAWQESHKLTILIYRVSAHFPKEEMFGITSQIRRAVVSIPSNIAEGFGRKTMKDKIHYYTISKGSLNEVYSQYMVCKDIGYLKENDWNEVEKQIIMVGKIINGLISKSNSFT